MVQSLNILSALRIAHACRPERYERYGAFAKPEIGASHNWSHERLKSSKTATITAGLLWLLFPRSRSASAAFVLASFRLQRETVRFHKPLFNYTWHAPISAAIEALGLARRNTNEAPVAALRALELYQASIYTQAGLAKLRDGGPSWVTEGSTIRVALSELGHPRAWPLIANKPAVRVLAAGTVACELMVLPIVLVGGTNLRRCLAVTLLTFHGGIKAVLNISFWHLWWQFVPALLWNRPEGRGLGRSVSPPAFVAGVAVAGNAASLVRSQGAGPFCAYNMFSSTVPEEYAQLRVRVHWEGRQSVICDTRGLMPFEFFRTVSMLEMVFVNESTPDSIRIDCAKAIVDGLNFHPWAPSDEIYASLRSPKDPHVTGFDLLTMSTSSRRPWKAQLESDPQFRVLYSFRCEE